MNTLVAAVLVALCGSALARPQVPTFNPFPAYNPINLNIPRPSATPTRPPVRAPPPPAPVRRPVVPAPLPQPAPIPVVTPNRIGSSQPSNDGHWIIIKQAKDQDIDGKYSWNYETENGIAAEETGGLKQVGPQEDGTASQGFYSYTAPDGTPIRVTYTADENGFVPDGAHLPVAPPIPEVIQRALAYNAAHPEEDLSEGGTKRV